MFINFAKTDYMMIEKYLKNDVLLLNESPGLTIYKKS